MAVAGGMAKITVCVLVPIVEKGPRIEVMSILSNIPFSKGNGW